MKISRKLRVWFIISSLIFISYGIYCFTIGKLYLPGERDRAAMPVDGFSMWFGCLAFLPGLANLILVVVDYYDRHDNNIKYKKLAKEINQMGWFCFGVSILLILVFVFTGKVV